VRLILDTPSMTGQMIAFGGSQRLPFADTRRESGSLQAKTPRFRGRSRLFSFHIIFSENREGHFSRVMLSRFAATERRDNQ